MANTSRRQVNTNTHINNINNNNNTSSKQRRYKHTMKITGLIASTLMLLLAVMASTASARGMDQPCYSGDLMIRHGKIHENKCCWNGRMLSGDRVAKCQNKPSNPNDCYAPKVKKEIMHGEIGPLGNSCCWYGKWVSKSNCS